MPKPSLQKTDSGTIQTIAKVSMIWNDTEPKLNWIKIEYFVMPISRLLTFFWSKPE